MSGIACEDLVKRILSLTSGSIIEEEWLHISALVQKRENVHYFPQVMETVFGTVINQVSSSLIEDTLLKPILSSFEKIFCSNILNIHNLVKSQYDEVNKDTLSEIHQILQVCLHVLGGYSLLIEYIVNLRSIKSQYVRSLIRTLPSVLLSAFSHCHKSQNLYGVYLLSSSDYLTALFRKSYELSSIFYKCIDECINFDFKVEDDTNIFVKALETLYSVGETVVLLDIKTMVEQWKWLVKITSRYACFLKDRLDVSCPIKFLTANLQDTITTMMIQQKEIDEKLRVRNLKLASFVLKVIVKLCEMCKGYLSGCEDPLLNLLLLLNRCSRLTKKRDSFEIERFVVVGATPLLSHLLEDKSFLERFSFKSENLESFSTEEAVGFLFTHARLLKFLISCNDEQIKECWMNIPLVPNVLTLFSMSYSMLDLNIKIEDNDTYTTLVSTTAAYIISCLGSEKFVEVECILLENLFNGKIESRVLVSDLLCLLGRLTNEEVCLNETIFLCQTLCCSDWHGIQSPESCIVGLTAGRLFHILSNTGQETIKKQFQPHLQPHIWLYLNHGLEASHDVISNISLNETKNFSANRYLLMMQYLTLCNSLNTEEVSNMINKAVEQLWTGFETYHQFDEMQPDWWQYIFFLFTKCIPRWIKNVDNFIAEKVLNDLLKFTDMKKSSVNYYVSVIVKKLTPAMISLNTSRLSSIFVKCISSDNFLIKQVAIESFVHFTSHCNDNIVIKNVTNDPNIEYYISDYFKKIPLCTANILTYISNIFVHNCFVHDVHPNKKIKYSSENQDIKLLLHNLTDCVNSIKHCICPRDLSAEEKDIINLAVYNLQNL